MKKSIFLFVSVLFAFPCFSQLPIQVAAPNEIPVPKVLRSHSSYTGKNHNSTASTQEFWINWGDTRDFMFSNTAVAYSSYLFNDSTVKAEFSGNVWDYVSVHSAMDVLDVKSQDWQFSPGFTWNQFTTYSVDSVAVAYAYTRTNPNANVVDTLVIHLFADYPHNSLSNSLNTWTTQNYPTLQTDYQTDTLKCLVPKYVYTTNKPNPGSANMMTVKVPLTTNDSTSFINYLNVKLPSVYNIGANQILFTAISYKPGVAYVTGDSIGGKKLNQFVFISYEEGGSSTLPSYTKCTPFKTNRCDWNESCIIPSSVRYNVTNNSWNGYYIPMWAYTKPYSLEHHQIWYKVTSNNVGMSETARNGLMLGQNSPNPSNGNTMIDYYLPGTSSVTLEVHDITGKKVLSINEGFKPAGANSIRLNTAQLTKGVYLYTLKAGDQQLTRRMTVTD